MAMAMVSWASLLIEPKLIAPVTKRRMMASSGSTSSKGIDLPGLKVRKSRKKIGSAFSSMACEYSLNFL